MQERNEYKPHSVCDYKRRLALNVKAAHFFITQINLYDGS